MSRGATRGCRGGGSHLIPGGSGSTLAPHQAQTGYGKSGQETIASVPTPNTECNALWGELRLSLGLPRKVTLILALGPLSPRGKSSPATRQATCQATRLPTCGSPWLTLPSQHRPGKEHLLTPHQESQTCHPIFPSSV